MIQRGRAGPSGAFDPRVTCLRPERKNEEGHAAKWNYADLAMSRGKRVSRAGLKILEPVSRGCRMDPEYGVPDVGVRAARL